MHTLILVLGLQCSTRLATCNFSENELIAKFARVSTSLKLPGIQYYICTTFYDSLRTGVYNSFYTKGWILKNQALRMVFSVDI